MRLNPYVFWAISILLTTLQLFIHMNIARRLLPMVRKAHEITLNQRINLIADANLQTQRARYGSLFILFVIYLPSVPFLIPKEESIWSGFIFMLVFYAQIFIIRVASNHAKIVAIQLNKLILSDPEAYIAYIQKRRP